MGSQDIERTVVIMIDPASQNGAMKDSFTIAERQAQ
jgi:hypothetical protein